MSAPPPLFRDVDLSRGSNGLWTGQLPFLPKNKPLSFIATASNSSSAVLFRGSTDQTLTEDNTPVSIVLAPTSDGAHITLPRVQRITLPAELFPEQSFPLRFLVEARPGERLDYAIAEGSSGTFFPSQGSLVLEGTSATVVIHYTAPSVPSTTDFSHSLRLTNRDGHSVSTTFRLRVRPPSSEGVRDTSVLVRFNPVINALSAVRVPGAPQVALAASVSDDRPLSELSYAWSLTPDGPEAAPTFSPQANPTLLQGYSLELRGTLLLEVTDAEGGKTTLRYVLPPNQFPDNPTQDTGFQSLLAGEGHTCVLLGTGAPRCWGRNDSGQLGYGHTLPLGDDESVSGSGYVPFGGRAIELVAGFAHTCALLDTGKVRCWGRNNSGQLGLGHTRPIGDDESPTSVGEVSLGGPVLQLAAHSTSQHTCARLESGSVRCWGRNAHGQLGLGHTLPIGDDETPASMASVSTGGIALQLATGAEHTCALLSPGVLKCWGRNESGQLGRGNTTSLSTPPGTPVDLGGTMAFQVAAGAWHTCVLPSGGEPRCWGRNTHGQLGLGHTYNLGDNEPPTSPPNTTPLAPSLVETFQSATTTSQSGSVTFRVRAMDPQGSRLSFSWNAGLGTLSTPTTEEETSEVVWTAPSDCASGANPTPTVTVANALGQRTSTTFTLSITGCLNCASILQARPASPSGVYRIDPDGAGSGAPFDAYCDMTQDGGGWTLLGRGEWAARESSSLPPGTHALLPASLRNSVLSTTGRLFRLGSGTYRLFISDPSPVISVGDGVWRTAASSLRCTTSYARVLNNTLATTSTKRVDCDPLIVGTHTCGYHGGWVLLMFYDTYNPAGTHPCAFGTGYLPSGQALTDLWVR